MGRNPAANNRASVILPTGAQSEWESLTQDKRVVVPSSSRLPERVAIEADMRRNGAINTSEEDFRKQMQERVAKKVAAMETKKEPEKPHRRKITLNDTN
jgi:hypothetical protein